MVMFASSSKDSPGLQGEGHALLRDAAAGGQGSEEEVMAAD